jgi:beta-glucosidase
MQVDVRNTGARTGEEVVQLYVSDVGAAHRPVKELKGFTRISLNAGETRTVTLTLRERDFAWYDDTKSRWVVDPGDFTIMVGGSSASLPLRKTITMR